MGNNATLLAALGELASVRAGHPFRGPVPVDEAGSTRVVQLKDITSSGSVDWHSTVRSDITGSRNPDLLKAGDLLFIPRGSKCQAVFLKDIPSQAVCSPHFYVIRPKSETSVLGEFLAWQLNQSAAQLYFRQNAEGSLQQYIRRPILESIQIVIPSLDRQHQILTLSHTIFEERQILEKLIQNRAQQLNAVAREILRYGG